MANPDLTIRYEVGFDMWAWAERRRKIREGLIEDDSPLSWKCR